MQCNSCRVIPEFSKTFCCHVLFLAGIPMVHLSSDKKIKFFYRQRQKKQFIKSDFQKIMLPCAFLSRNADDDMQVYSNAMK